MHLSNTDSSSNTTPQSQKQQTMPSIPDDNTANTTKAESLGDVIKKMLESLPNEKNNTMGNGTGLQHYIKIPGFGAATSKKKVGTMPGDGLGPVSSGSWSCFSRCFKSPSSTVVNFDETRVRVELTGSDREKYNKCQTKLAKMR